MENPKMTKTQQSIYSAIADFQKKNGYSPSLHEIKSQTGYSVGKISRHISTMEAAGFLERVARRVIRLNMNGRDDEEFTKQLRKLLVYSLFQIGEERPTSKLGLEQQRERAVQAYQANPKFNALVDRLVVEIRDLHNG